MLIETEFNKNDEDEKIDTIDYIYDELRNNKEQITRDEYIEINVDIEQDGEYTNIEIKKNYYESDIIVEFEAEDENYNEELENKLEDSFECFIDDIIEELKEKLDI